MNKVLGNQMCCIKTNKQWKKWHQIQCKLKLSRQTRSDSRKYTIKESGNSNPYGNKAVKKRYSQSYVHVHAVILNESNSYDSLGKAYLVTYLAKGSNYITYTTSNYLAQTSACMRIYNSKYRLCFEGSHEWLR